MSRARSQPRIASLALAALITSVACACAESEEPPFARRDFMQFQREVYPVLLRDCGFPQCHGAPERFFRVWGPGRQRLPSPMTGELPEAFDLPAGHELSSSYSLALSMIDEASPSRSALLRKPLAIAAGGSGHLGVDKYGRDVYRTSQDSGYIALARWVLGMGPRPDEPSGTGGMMGTGGAMGTGGRPGEGGADAATPGTGGMMPIEPGEDAGMEPGSGGTGGSGGAGMPDSGMPPDPIRSYRGCMTAADCDPDATCAITPSLPTNASVCLPPCVDVGDCPVPGGTYDADVACVLSACRIDCTPVLFGPLRSCPTGMTCISPLLGAAYCHDDGM